MGFGRVRRASVASALRYGNPRAKRLPRADLQCKQLCDFLPSLPLAVIEFREWAWPIPLVVARP